MKAWLIGGLCACVAGMVGAPKKPAEFVLVAVSTAGDDAGDGSAAHPFRTLERAQQAVRAANAEHDVHVQLADGIYRIGETLVFGTLDGGRNGHQVVWEAASGAHPVISGGVRVTDWKMFDRARGIYVAETPKGLDTRQVWVNDRLAAMASREIPRSSVEFTQEGIVLKDPKLAALASSAPDAGRMEVSATGFFTKRISPVERVRGNVLVMKQPAWNNNIWGYDTLNSPYHPELAHLYLANSLALVSEAGQWAIDPAQGRLYLRPRSQCGSRQYGSRGPEAGDGGVCKRKVCKSRSQT